MLVTQLASLENQDSTSNVTLDPVPDARDLVIFTISDSSGETAEAVARAALVQFPPGRASIYRLPQVRSCQQLVGLIGQVSQGRSIIAYTLVLPEYRETLEAEAAKHEIPTIDLLSPLISRIANTTGLMPLSQPGRLHILQENRSYRLRNQI
jgi:regulator of PEP synthase PpsR (kinase-PPPase family)